MPDAYLTGSGAYLPGEPLDHDAIAQRLGRAGPGGAPRPPGLPPHGIRPPPHPPAERGGPPPLNQEPAPRAGTPALGGPRPPPRAAGLSLRVDWIHLVSHAHRYPVCMSAGGTASRSWQDLPDSAAAEREGLLRLRQDVKLLPSLFRVGLQEFMALVRDGRINPA